MQHFTMSPTDDWQSKRDAILNVLQSGDRITVSTHQQYEGMRECLLQIRLGGVLLEVPEGGDAQPVAFHTIDLPTPLFPIPAPMLSTEQIALMMMVPSHLLGPPPPEANCLPDSAIYVQPPIAAWLARHPPLGRLKPEDEKHFARNVANASWGNTGEASTPIESTPQAPLTGRRAGCEVISGSLPQTQAPMVKNLSIHHGLSGMSAGQVEGCLEMIGTIEDILGEIRRAVNKGSLHDQRFEGEVHLRLKPAVRILDKLGRSPDVGTAPQPVKRSEPYPPRIDPDGIARRFIVASNFERYRIVCDENHWDRLMDARPVLILRPIPKPEEVIDSIWHFDESAKLFSQKDKEQIAKLGMMVPKWFWDRSDATIGQKD